MFGSVLSGAAREAAASSSKTKSSKKHILSAQAFLDSAGVAIKVVEYRGSEKACTQGDPARSVTGRFKKAV
jgi:hypothetical protein